MVLRPALWLLLAALPQAAAAADWAFDVQFTPGVHAEACTGRVYIFFSRFRKEPRTGPDWFHPELFIARDVADWKPGETVSFRANEPRTLRAYPVPLAKMQLDGYRAQAVVRFNPYERQIGTGPGNGYSPVLSVSAQAAAGAPPVLVVDKLVAARPFPESKWTKLLRIRSPKLSEFHKRDVYLQAAVLLPASYETHPGRRYPTIFMIPGFGSTHLEGVRSKPINEQNERGVEFIRVTLDPSCPRGHHVFADSANNGPYGSALVEEFIPAFDKAYRSIPEPSARFLTGHSSGGWSSLWLQITYPDHFGGTWSTAPDPVDFRDFQRINLYQPGENMYVDAKGNERPIARMGNAVLLWYRGFGRMEQVLGYGGQLHSFEAVFSPRGADGAPLAAWDRGTGAVHTDVTRAWEQYDIRLVLERNWPELGPKLAGKLHVFMGEEDTFYLEEATRLLKESLTQLSSDAVVEMAPGKDHFSLYSPQLLGRIRREMVQTFLQQHPDYGRE